MTHQAPLAHHMAVFKRVRAQIAADFDLDEDDRAVIDSAEGETELADYLVTLVRAARNAEATVKGIEEFQRQMADRKARFQRKHDRLKSIVMHAMADAGLSKLPAPDFTAARTRTQAPLVVTNPDGVPDDLCRISREPDKTKIREALKAGKIFGFAYLGNAAETLTVRGS